MAKSPASAVVTPTHLLVTHLGPCEEAPSSVLKMSELSITTHTFDSWLTGEFNLTEDVEDGWSVKATMKKCQDIRNTDTCDHYTSWWVVRHGCQDDDSEEMTAMLFHYASPELECPISAGSYRLDSYPFFSEDNFLTVSETKISTSIFGYTLWLEGYTVDKRNLFCIEAYLELLYMREHKWVDGKKPRVSSTTPAPDNE